MQICKLQKLLKIAKVAKQAEFFFNIHLHHESVKKKKMTKKYYARGRIEGA